MFFFVVCVFLLDGNETATRGDKRFAAHATIAYERPTCMLERERERERERDRRQRCNREFNDLPD